jgi:DNA-binding NtrC family response regulator
VIAATNKDLKQEIERNAFREDLYHRLSVILIHVPSLNERQDDIPLIANYFLEQICDDYKMPRKEFTKDALEALNQINWTGNIRELRNVVERLIILCDKTITKEDVMNYAAKAEV